MNTPSTSNKVYFSLGSNMGSRFNNLQKAVDLLFEEVGSILRISAVYETPAAGFKGDPFLNCVVLVRTEMEPLKVLKTILLIEKTLGRQRKISNVYVSRPIDIDMLFFDKEVIFLENLTVPHPRMEERKFVLQPFVEIEPHFVHPLFQKTIDHLLKETKDVSSITQLDKFLTNPMSEINISKYNYIAIEGNIGAGKTSLATKISQDFNAKLILERFKDNPFLPKFYKDASRYAFPLEMSFLADRYQQLVDDITQLDLFKEAVVADYDVNKSLIFAGITLPEEEYALYRKLFQVMHKELPTPDVYIYLYQNTERLLENIKKRGRNYEKSIPAEYLQKLSAGYFEFIKSQPADKIRIIDITEMDFIKNRSDYLKILREIVR